jgi:hypothetical protein
MRVTAELVEKATPCSGRYCNIADAIWSINPGAKPDRWGRPPLVVFPKATEGKWYARYVNGDEAHVFELPAATGIMAHDFDELDKRRFLEIYAGREIELPEDLVKFMEEL